MLALCRTYSLTQPAVTGWIQLDGVGFSPDFLWPEAKLIVETDGGVHRTRRASEAGYATLPSPGARSQLSPSAWPARSRPC
jgi:hypothetical protein